MKSGYYTRIVYLYYGNTVDVKIN